MVAKYSDRVMLMQYKSTRNSKIRLEASQVIVQGISEEGGLFIPERVPDISGQFSRLSKLGYQALARDIFSYFLTDFTHDELEACVSRAYTQEKFGPEPVLLKSLAGVGNRHILELWHGPTCAFKDMALQILPYFLSTAQKKNASGREAVILVATSGDTGKAALEGFRDVPDTRVVVFYPQNGVSPMQKKQMISQEGQNVNVCAIHGNFDDAQTAVKHIFTDEQTKLVLKENGMMFSSANSINWGRLLPQIVYYFYAYFKLSETGKVELGQPINIVVPTGNFGNILAAYYASQMGLPVNRFICASNTNKVLTDFIHTGIYDRRREFYTTSSPSMDILISSNLERLLYAFSSEDDVKLADWMNQLASGGHYDVGDEVKNRVQKLFFAGYSNDEDTANTLKETWISENYLCDTHTAVALGVYNQYVEATGDENTPTVIASTASPYKFAGSVLEALNTEATQNEFANIAVLEKLTGIAAPIQLKALQEKAVRFTEAISSEQVSEYVLKTLGIGR